ncbi:hypothetical protein ARMSODRAFT_688548 [Armillaria solidipes]|uniref:Uncharacterized protein n=1 Tax=Armillaria solidipes TaxID=1076256 RepID=A0A2H3APK4_9AGAR|nr:hypothetical protein ARMSODRAFT_688548 [Armillaria solidipes]
MPRFFRRARRPFISVAELRYEAFPGTSRILNQSALSLPVVNEMLLRRTASAYPQIHSMTFPFDSCPLGFQAGILTKRRINSESNTVYASWLNYIYCICSTRNLEEQTESCLSTTLSVLCFHISMRRCQLLLSYSYPRNTPAGLRICELSNAKTKDCYLRSGSNVRSFEKAKLTFCIALVDSTMPPVRRPLEL